MGFTTMVIPTIQSNSEPFLQEKQRFTLDPIHKDIWEMYKKQQALFWTAEEIDFSKDPQDWDNLSEDYKWFIKHILAFFAGTDSIVSLNIMENFTKDVPILEVQACYALQAYIENVHSETYALMIKTYIKDPNEKEEMFNARLNFPCVKKKMDWAEKWVNKEEPFAKRLIGFAIVEGLFFSGAFCAIYWLKEQNILPGLTLSNVFIARDEGMHCEFACLLYSKMINRLSDEEMQDMMKEAVDIEKEFIVDSLPCRLIGMNSDLMSQYIEYVADRLMVMLGYNKKYNVQNPFRFMDAISVDSKENFFETRGSQYSKASVINKDIPVVSFTDDF